MSDLALTSETLSATHYENGETHVLLKIKTEENPKALEEITRVGNINGVVPMNYHQAAYGEQAKKLRLSAFFRTPAVWEYIGRDSDYQAWCRKLPCARTKNPGLGADSVIYAHCRRVQYKGNGTGSKPPYRGIPMLA